MSNPSINRLLEPYPKEKMTAERELAAAKTFRRFKSGSRKQAAFEEIVLGHMRDAFFYAYRCCRGALPFPLIVSLCYEALSRAIVNFDPARQRFFAYAKIFIRGAVFKTWKSQDVVSGSSQHEEEEDPLRRMTNGDDAPPPHEGEVTEPDWKKILTHDRMALVQPLLDDPDLLTEHEREILILRFAKDMTFVEIAKKFSTTRSAAQGCASVALRKLRNALLARKQLYSE